jgi:alkylation response protein AidB-like acyl-CoA dehydrogenase
MDFVFNDEQQMLRESARSYLAERFGPERVAEIADSGGYGSEDFKEIAALGWTGLSLPEDAGGAGMGFLEESVLFEELGYGLYPGPFFSTIGLAAPVLPPVHPLAARIAAGEAAATLAWAEPSGPAALASASEVRAEAKPVDSKWSLSGTKELVPDLDLASYVVVAARADDGVGAWVVETSDVEVEALSTMDPTRKLGRLHLDQTTAELAVAPGEAPQVLAAVRLRALAALALEAVGIAQRVTELAVEHAKERKQFGKPIGAFQAVSHQIADAYMETELARSLAYWAAWCVAEDDPQTVVAVSSAKAQAAQAALDACERSIQVHGGMGFTWEHVLHRFYKRARWIESFEAGGTTLRADIAQRLLG